MIDNFALALTHALLALAAWRLLQRSDLDQEPAEVTPAAADTTSADTASPDNRRA
jgi:hypothetical protein